MAQACRSPLSRLALDQGTHSGLLLSRYVQTPVKEGDQKDRDQLLASAKQACNNCIPLYTSAYKTWQNQIVEKCIREQLRVDGRMILGLGSESPLETGLRLHHTYGTPLIPGSALKGLAAHYCDQVWGKQDQEFRREIEYTDENGKSGKRCGKYFLILFGTTEDSGHIVFHDAWITPESLQNSLVLDVMTVHHPKYYQGNDAPSDFDDPTPIPFLSIQGTFEIALHCDVNGEDWEKWIRLAMALLREALSQWGIGGKTNAGYGRLKVPSTLSKPAEQLVSAEEYKTSQTVQCVVLEEKTRKGGWKFQIKGSDQTGILHPQSPEPPDLAPGKELSLTIASTGTGIFQFRWTNPDSQDDSSEK